MIDDRGEIDWSDPLTDHPLNRGLVFAPILGGPGWRSKRLIDASPRRNHGALVNGVTWQAGARPALSFDSVSSQYAVVDAYWQLPLTISCWVHLQGAVNGAIVKVGGVNDGVGLGIGDGSTMSNDGRNLMLVRGGKGFNDAALTVPDGWSFVAAAVSSSAIQFIVASASVVVSTGSTNPATSDSRIGGYVAGRYLDGLVADPRIYNRALSTSEVAALHQQGLLGNPDLYRRVRSRRRAATITPVEDVVVSGGCVYDAPYSRRIYDAPPVRRVYSAPYVRRIYSAPRCH